MQERQDKIRVLINWLSDQINKRDFKLWNKLNPCEAEAFWMEWDKFDIELLGYLKGDIPVQMIREYAQLIIQFDKFGKAS